MLIGLVLGFYANRIHHLAHTMYVFWKDPNVTFRDVHPVLHESLKETIWECVGLNIIIFVLSFINGPSSP